MKNLEEAVAGRGIRRLCHFTPSRNLAHILASGEGLLATRRLSDDDRMVVNRTDLQRYDGHTGHICCSIEYPNSYYFRTARAGEILFKDWVVVLLDASLLLVPGVKFSPRNAAAGSGAYLHEGLPGFEALYAPSVAGARGQVFRRSNNRPIAAPTDMQAEVLIPQQIPSEKLTRVAVRTEEQARLEIERLRALRLTHPPFVVAPIFYDASALRDALNAGNVPAETPYVLDAGLTP